MKRYNKVLLIIASLALISACDQKKTVVYTDPNPQDQQVQQVQQPSTVIVQQQPQNSGAGDFATGMLVGHMLSSSHSNYSPTVVHNTTVIHKTYVSSIVQAPAQRSTSAPKLNITKSPSYSHVFSKRR